MKKLLGVFTLVLASVIPAFGQGVLPVAGGSHVQGGVFYAPVYNSWRASIVSGNSGTGAGTSIVVTAPTALSDGYVVPIAAAYNTTTPITINDNNSETFTPSGVTIGSCGGFANYPSGQCATITGTIANTHGAGSALIVQSGDFGAFEAITDAGNQGGGVVYWEADTGIVTLSTTGLTTTTLTKVPTQFMSMGASARVTTTITGSTAWLVGISGTTNAFCTSDSTLTAGTTCLANMNSPALVGSTNSLTAVLITATVANATAGAVKARVWGFTPVQAAQ